MRALALTLAALGGGCLQGDLNRDRVLQPLAESDVAGLRPQEDDLAVVLARLGAPLYVRELGDGIALAYGWLDTTNWNLEAQVPVGDAGSFQFTYNSTREALPGVVVFLDANLRVVRIERGLLRNLVPAAVTPRDLDLDDEP